MIPEDLLPLLFLWREGSRHEAKRAMKAERKRWETEREKMTGMDERQEEKGWQEGKIM